MQFGFEELLILGPKNSGTMRFFNFCVRMPKLDINEQGQALSEYSFLASFLAGAMIFSLVIFTNQVNDYFEEKTAELQGKQITIDSGDGSDDCLVASGNGNNGHGNNSDGVDSSNPGQGKGGPNGGEDASGDVDDENKNSQNSDAGSTDCDEESNGNGNNGNGNNGHGNNDDGVDSSNPGQGDGGPNGEEDPSGDIDDEGGNGNGNGKGNGNGNGNGKKQNTEEPSLL